MENRGNQAIGTYNKRKQGKIKERKEEKERNNERKK